MWRKRKKLRSAWASTQRVASAKTAPWVDRFFEADAQLETTADAHLLPLAHTETIVEGKRRVERQLAFDFTRRQVSVTTGGGDAMKPLTPCWLGYSDVKSDMWEPLVSGQTDHASVNTTASRANASICGMARRYAP